MTGNITDYCLGIATAYSSNESAGLKRELTETEALAVDAAGLVVSLGKKVIHVGGRPSTDQLFELAEFDPAHRVLDVGCRVGSTAIELATEFGCEITAVDFASTMVERAAANAGQSGVGDLVDVGLGDTLDIDFPDGSFDRVIVEAVTMFVDRQRAISELVWVCKPGGWSSTTRPISSTERQRSSLTSVKNSSRDECEDEETWVGLFRSAGLTELEFRSGPAEFVGSRYMIRDEGVRGFLKILGRLITQPSYMRRMAFTVPRIRRVQPHLEIIVIAGRKPA